MLDAHPPFQIDGNFGFTSGLTEMLVQSHDGAIHLIPALPDVWNNGSVSGLKARGGFEIKSIVWKDGKVNKVVLKSNLGGNCRIRSYNELAVEGGETLAEAKGINENLLFQVPTLKVPLISEKAELKGFKVKNTYMYDIETEVGQEIILIKN